MATGSLIVQSYLGTFTDGMANELRYEQKMWQLLNENEGVSFLTPLNYQLSLLKRIDRAQFPYMNEVQKEEALRVLQATLLLLLTQRQYELDHQKTENRRIYTEQISKCHQLIDALQYGEVCEENGVEPSPEQGYASEENPVKYLAFFFGQWLAEKIASFMERKTKTIKENMGSFNEKRLYWVWGGGLVKNFLGLLPSDFWNVEQGKKTVRMPDPYTGAISWALYYFRFALNLSLLLKHTIAGPWMTSEAELNTPWKERFLTQWAQRKFTLLNDFFWATGNALCFFLLYGPGAMGAWGDVLTLALLTFDITLAVWEFAEEQTLHNEEMLNYEENIQNLKAVLETFPSEEDYAQRVRRDEHVLRTWEAAQKEYLLAEGGAKEEDLLNYEHNIQQLKQQIEEAKKDIKERREYEAQLYALKKAQSKCQREWEHKKRTLIVNICYAVGLLLSFFLLAAPFLPALATVGPVGAVLCFALTVVCKAVKGGMEIQQIKQSIKEIKEEIRSKTDEFRRLLSENPDRDNNEKKFLFLEIKKLMAESKYQQQQADLQTAHLIRSVLFETLVPAIVLTNLVFLPLGTAFFGVVAAVIGLALLTNLIINYLFTPEQTESQPFNEMEYETFCHGIEKASKSPTFFQSSESQFTTKEAAQEEQEQSTEEVNLLTYNGLNRPL